MTTVYQRRYSRVQRPNISDLRLSNGLLSDEGPAVISHVIPGSAFDDYEDHEPTLPYRSNSSRFGELNFEEAIVSLEDHGFVRVMSRDLSDGDEELLLFWHYSKGICVFLSSDRGYINLAEMFYEWIPDDRDNLPNCVSYTYGHWVIPSNGIGPTRWKGGLNLKVFSLGSHLDELSKTGTFVRNWDRKPNLGILGSVMFDEYRQYESEPVPEGGIRVGHHEYTDRLINIWFSDAPEEVRDAMCIGQEASEDFTDMEF